MAKLDESKVLRTAADVAAALDGFEGLQAMTGRSYKRCWDWVNDGHFPPIYYLLMTHELRKRGKRARPSLWRMRTTPEIERAVA